MAKKHYLVPGSLARKIPVLRNLSWKLEASVVKFLVVLMRAMTPERAASFANFIFRNLRPLLPFAAKIRRNLAIAFPQKNAREIKQLTRKTCGNLGNAAAELVLADRIWAERDQRIEFVMEDGTDLADYRDRPAVMVTGHIGAWQIATFVAVQYQLRITSIFAPEANPHLQEFFVSLRSALPVEFIARDGCMRGLMQELKQGHIVGLVSDTRLEGGDELPFFGIPVPTNTTAARLAIRHNCDLFPVRAERLQGMRFRITLCRPIRPSDPHASVSRQAQQMTLQLFEHFEAWIREAPDQWMCFGRRWPHEAYANISPHGDIRPKST
jgi:Kdo2-lipid IVA lauroyltransferase/acyltransferase